MPPHPIQTTWDADILGGDPLGWPGYQPPDEESVVTGRTAHYAFAEGRFDVRGGSMGAAHGERVVRAFRRAIGERLPMLVVASSGGARMQEGMVSLIQMARTAAAAADHAAAGLLSLAIYRQPTTGGVFASYASLVDVRAAEPGATVGFAGPRVVELTLGRKLPDGSHTAESAWAAGLVDTLVAPPDHATWVDAALGLRALPLALPLPDPHPDPHRSFPEAGTETVPNRRHVAWDEVLAARDPGRPTGIDWAARLCSSWTELRGADPTVRAGLATLARDGRRLVVVAHDRHADDGRTKPAGFRLARRAIALAGRVGLPLLTLVDTPGADPAAESEAAGVASEIASTLAAMAELPTPSVSVCVGEGGSGGALAIAAADRLLMQDHAVFSVIGPEGAAAILERDVRKAPDLAERLRLTSRDLVEMGIADATVAEDADAMAGAISDALAAAEPGDRRRRFDTVTEKWLQ
ncbi:MAG: Acetyl-CoA carboxylase carboxyl transferase subunit beta [Acidimicrobiales bacterium]|nr:Acetyl-CoA carboxylase carboxyl transferase subunit beta [Acidimicrobiales bacterium]